MRENQEQKHERNYLDETQKTLFLWKEFCKEISQVRKKADEICHKYNMSKEEFGTYVDNPSNFSHVEWERLEAHRKKTATCFEEIRKCHSSIQSFPFMRKPKEKLKKAKRLFGPRENWLRS